MTGDLNCLSTDKAYQILTGGSTSNSDQPTFLDTAEEVITSPDDNSEPSDDPSTLRGRFGEEFSNPAFPEDNLDPKTIDFIFVLDNGYPVKDR